MTSPSLAPVSTSHLVGTMYGRKVNRQPCTFYLTTGHRKDTVPDEEGYS